MRLLEDDTASCMQLQRRHEQLEQQQQHVHRKPEQKAQHLLQSARAPVSTAERLPVAEQRTAHGAKGADEQAHDHPGKRAERLQNAASQGAPAPAPSRVAEDRGASQPVQETATGRMCGSPHAARTCASLGASDCTAMDMHAALQRGNVARDPPNEETSSGQEHGGREAERSAYAADSPSARPDSLARLAPELAQLVEDLVDESQGAVQREHFDERFVSFLAAQPRASARFALETLLAMAPCLDGTQLLADAEDLVSDA